MTTSPLIDPARINEANREATRLAFSVCTDAERTRMEMEQERQTRRGRAALAEWQAADANRLVKAQKSPTEGSAGRFLFDVGRVQRAAEAPPAPVLLESEPETWAQDCQGPGRFAVVQYRRWADEYRIRTEVDPGNLAPPEPPRGTRYTEMLTERGARKIAESCYYVAKTRGGYNTFLTLTLDETARQRLARRIVEPVGTLADGLLVQEPEPEAAQDRKGELGPVSREQGDPLKAYDPADPENFEWIESRGESVAGNSVTVGPWTCIDPETARPYNPVQARWEWSIQKEASRFFEAMGKMYRRGWQYKRATKAGDIAQAPGTGAEYTPIEWETVKVPGSKVMYCVHGEEQDQKTGAWFTRLKWWREPLDYLWVAEAPDRKESAPYKRLRNLTYARLVRHQQAHKYQWVEESGGGFVCVDAETGEVQSNPHLHVMMRWRVPYRHFRAWANRVETLWGQGMAHLEKIKQPEKAGAYVAKAAGYLSKAQGKDDQGTIRGNRYGISQRSRAPGWIEQERYQIGVMGWLLAEAAEKWEERHGEKVQRRERLKHQLEQADTRERRQKIGRMLEQVRGELEPLPRVNKYQALLKGKDQIKRFMDWARRQGFQQEPGTGQWLAQWRANQWQRRHGNRLQAAASEVANWLEMADAGAVCLEDSELDDWGLYADFGLVHLPGLPEAGKGQVFTGNASVPGL